MPRNSSGTYSLYTPGNPVVPSTVITTTWANNTLSDLATAMTDSLSRSGDGGMLAPLELVAGAVGAPGLAWTAEPTAGLYRASAGNFRYAIGGSDILTITSTGLAVAGTITASNFTGFANPSAFIGLTAVNGSATTAMRSDAAPALSQAIVPTWTGQHEWSLSLRAPNGAVGTPAYTFSNDLDTGIYRVTTNEVGIAAGGTLIVSVNTAGLTTVLPVFAANGTAGAPSLSFASDPDTGIFRLAANTVMGTAGGAEAFGWDTAGVYVRANHRLFVQDGAAATPAIAFDNDSNTGIYSVGADSIGVATGGTNRVTVGPGVQVGAPTGGDQGAGTVNATGYYINGAQIVGATYTPTLTNTTNISGSTSAVCQYIRVGNVVTVSGIVTATITTGGIVTVLDVSLPVASNFANTVQASGAGSANGAVINVEADAVNDRITLYWTSIGTGAQFVRFTCTYLIV